MSVSAALRSRVRRPSYLNKIAKAEDLIDVFPHGSYIGWSGFTGVGYPKYFDRNRHQVIVTNINTYQESPHCSGRSRREEQFAGKAKIQSLRRGLLRRRD